MPLYNYLQIFDIVFYFVIDHFFLKREIIILNANSLIFLIDLGVCKNQLLKYFFKKEGANKSS